MEMEMVNGTNRFAYFLFGCVGIRTLFVIIAAKVDKNVLQYLSIIGLLIAISWILIYRFDLRPVGKEAGGTIWWNNLRVFHAINYTTFAILAFTKSNYAWVPLAIDVITGLCAVINHRFAKR